MIPNPLAFNNYRKIIAKIGFKLKSKNPDTKYSTKVGEIPSNFKFGRHDSYSLFEIFAIETIFQLFKYPLMSVFKFSINLDYNTEFKKIFNWVEYKREKNIGIKNNVNITPMKNKKKKDQLKEIENNKDSLPSYLYNNVYEEVVDDYKFIKSEKTGIKRIDKLFAKVIKAFNLDETVKKENGTRNRRNAQIYELPNGKESNVEQSETSIERRTERESEFEKNRCELTSEYEIQNRTEPESKKQKKNLNNIINSDQEIKLEKHNAWLSDYYKKNILPESINKIFVTRKGKKIRSRLLSDGDLSKLNFQIKVEGDFDFLIHSLEGNVLTEILTDEEISPFIFYGNFELKKIHKYDIIGEVKEFSNNKKLDLIKQVRNYIQLIYNLKRSKRLNNNLGFTKENEKILMYVFNSEYQKFIMNILDFRINRNKFKEMERYQELKSYQNILENYGLNVEQNEIKGDVLIKNKELNQENKIHNVQKENVQKNSGVDNAGKGDNKEIKNNIELCDIKNKNEIKVSNNKGNEENSNIINQQKNMLMSLIIESGVPFVFIFIQNLVGYEKVQIKTQQNLQKEIQKMKENLTNQEKEMEEKLANQKKEMEEKLANQKKEMDKKMEELNLKISSMINNMNLNISTNQNMDSNKQAADNMKK